MSRAYSNYADIIDFTRASSGTALRRVKYGAELVTNGAFDTDSDWTKGTGWSISGGVAVSSGSNNYAGLQQIASLTVGKVYSVTFTISSYTSGSLKFAIGSTTGNLYSSVGTFTENFVYIEPHASGKNVSIFPWGAFVGTIDNVSVKEVTFDTSDGDLVLFNHPANIPRIEYDADGNVLGLLVEESRTNLIPYSDLSSNWTEFNATKTISSVEAPNGDLMYELNATATGVPTGTVTTYSSTSGTYTVSAILKAGTTNYAFVGISDNATGQAEIRFNLSSGTYDTTNVGFVGSWTNVSGSIVNLGNGFYRCSTTGTQGAGNPVSSRIIAGAPDGSRSQTVINTKLYATGAQLESGSFMTSLIPTSGSTATRSADVASLSTSAFGYRQDEGSVVVDLRYNGVGASPRILCFSDGTNTNRIVLDRIPMVTVVNNNSVTVSDATTSASSVLTPYKVGLSLSDSNTSITIDGETPSTSSGTIPKVISKLIIGDGQTSPRYINGHIKSLRYYPRALTNAQLQELTS